MKPVIIHADGTDCHHEGTPQATALEEVGPLCPAGIPVTHVRFNGQVLTIEQAAVAFVKLGEAFSEAVRPLFAAMAEFGRRISEDPALRVLASRAEGDQR